MNQPAPAFLYRPRAQRIIAQEDLELRRRGLDEPTDLSGTAELDGLHRWARVLELCFMLAAVEEAMARLGVRVFADAMRESHRIEAFVTAVTRLDAARIAGENEETFRAAIGGKVPTPGCRWRARAHRSLCRTYRRGRESGTVAPRRRGSRYELLRDPGLRREARRRREHDLAGGELNEHEREDRAEEHVIGLQKVAGPDLLSVVS
jgi:hypothetical protein